MTEMVAHPETGQSGAPALRAWALALFDHTQPAHKLPGAARHMLQIAADCYQAAGVGEADQVARRGRDLALAAPIAGLKPDEQAIVAGAVALQRDKPRPRREPALLRLDTRDQRVAMRLAAMLQLARSLGPTPAALLTEVDDGSTTLVIGGAAAAELVGAATAHADLWRDSIGELTIRAAEPEDVLEAVGNIEDGSAPTLVPTATPPDDLTGDESIAEGGRRVLRRFFGRMLAREDAVLKDDDPEDVHQMRVASRRLRAALQVVEAVYDPKQVRRYRRGLRRVAQALGDVRDLDVFHEHVVAYQATLPEQARDEIAPLLTGIEAERTTARATLLKDLDQQRYEKFKRAFATFLTTPGADLVMRDGMGAATRVRDFAGSAIWRRYEQWRAHEVALAHPSDADLHEARIAGKRLRYTLEFFADALGPNVAQALNPLIALQECLGALQDAVVAHQRVHEMDLGDDTGAQAYLQRRDAERATQLADLPTLWDKVGSATYRRRLFELIVKI